MAEDIGKCYIEMDSDGYGQQKAERVVIMDNGWVKGEVHTGGGGKKMKYIPKSEIVQIQPTGRL